jgi:DNA-directed RNA polymerase subunit L
MNKDIITLDHNSLLFHSDGRDEGLMNRLKELNLKTEKIFKEMHSYRIAQKRSKKIKRIWASKL